MHKILLKCDSSSFLREKVFVLHLLHASFSASVTLNTNNATQVCLCTDSG